MWKKRGEREREEYKREEGEAQEIHREESNDGVRRKENRR